MNDADVKQSGAVGRRHIGPVFKPDQTWPAQEQEIQDEDQDLPVTQKSSTANSPEKDFGDYKRPCREGH